MRSRILILGGSRFQVPLIRLARQRGLHVITCDYLPDNPGHRLADEYHNVSTTDKDAVLALARRIGIDAVASLSSDPAMQTVAYVANALGLPGPRLDGIVKLTEKDALRRLMSDIGLRTPRRHVLCAADAADAGDFAAMLAGSAARHIVKPVDSCGSRGVTVLEPGGGDFSSALQRALAQSRARRCIVEEYIDGEQLHGDGFLQDGRLVHHYLGDQGFLAQTQDSVPTTTYWPSKHGEAVLREVARQVEAIAQASGHLDGPVNIEARVSPAGEVFIIEVGPRNGGDYIPIIQHRLTGFEFVGKVLDSALGIRPEVGSEAARRGIGVCHALHTDRDGRYAGVEASAAIKEKLFLIDIFRQLGDPVQRHQGAGSSLGVALLEFDSMAERDRLMAEVGSHLKAVVH
jgi:biotin carboxylase